MYLAAQYIFAFFPVLVFLAGLYLFDSFKLVRKVLLLLSLSWGALAALISYYLNTALIDLFQLNFETFTGWVAPFTEESLKALVVVLLVVRRRIGFTVDAAIYGFAAGTGFALLENVFYLYRLSGNPDLIVWVLRGFGTALMHGGNTALFAVLLMSGIQRDKAAWLVVWPALLAAVLMHAVYNHFFLDPFLQMIFLLLILPVVFVIIFQKNNSLMQHWLEIEFSHEVEMLRMIREGQFRTTRAGTYLASLKAHFDSEMILDLYCYISLYLELSIKAKRNIMLRENGFRELAEPGIAGKLRELRQLRRQIGKVGEMALRPLVRMKHRELYKLGLLNQQTKYHTNISTQHL